MITYDLVGQTPLVLLESFNDEHVQIYAKLEQFSPGGSIKDRLGKHLVKTALKEKRIVKGGTIAEAITGDTGIGSAMTASRYRLKCVISAPEGFSEEKILITRVLGVEVKRTPKNKGTMGAQKEARHYADRYNVVYTNQFETEHNPKAYTHTPEKEITEVLSHIDYLIASAGSGETFIGVTKHLQQFNVKNIIVELEGSVLNGGKAHAHDIEGIGSEKWPVLLEKSIVDDIVTVSDSQGFENIKRLAKQEGLLVGSSSGAALQGALDIKNRVDRGIAVTISPDGSDRYMSKKIFEYKGE